MKKIAVLVLVLLAAFPLAACGSKKGLIPVQSVSFYEKSVELAVGESAKLQYKIFPANSTNQNVQFTSSDPSAVSVDGEGNVTLNRNQSAIVTVRTLDGMFESSCSVKPVKNPELISLDQSKTEQKRDGNVNKNVLMLTVGQTKVLPVLVFPSTASKNRFSFSFQSDSKDPCVQIEKGAEWLIHASSEGRCIVTVTCPTDSGETVVELEVWVAAAPEKLSVFNETELQLDANLSCSVGYNIGESGLLRVELSKNEFCSEHVKFTASVTNSDVVGVTTIDSYEQYQNELSSLADSAMFNHSKYIKIEAKAEGSATLFLVSDAQNASGNPFSLVINIEVGREPEVINLSVNTNKLSSGESLNPILLVGQSFSLNVDAFARVTEGGVTETRPVSLSGRKVYYELAANDSVKLIGADQNDLSVINLFMAEKSSGNVAITIKVHVAKSRSAGDYSVDSTSYISKSIDVMVEEPVLELAWKVGDDWLSNNREIVLVAGNGDILDLSAYCVNGFNSYVSIDSTSWTYRVLSDNNNVIEVTADKKLQVVGNGAANITILLNYGENAIACSIRVNIEIKV